MIRAIALVSTALLAALPLQGASAAACYPSAVKDGAAMIGTIEGPFAFELWLQEVDLLIKMPFEPEGDQYVPTGFSVTPFDLSRFSGEYKITGRRGKPLRSGNADGLTVLKFTTYALDQYGGNWVNVTLETEGGPKATRFQVPSSYEYADRLAKLKDGWTAYRQSGRDLCPAKGTPG